MNKYKFGLDGWISPKGKYFKCFSEEHRFTAKEIIDKMSNIPELLTVWKMDRYLQDIGWIKIVQEKFRRFAEIYPITITKKQLDFIFDYLEEREMLNKTIIFNDTKFKNYQVFLEKYS